MRILLFTALMLPAISARAQFHFESSIHAGYPLMLSGANKFSAIVPALRATLSYRLAGSRLQPYFAASTGIGKFPLQSRLEQQLTMPVLATSLLLGLTGVARYDEGSNSEWLWGGGIGLMLLRNESSTLYVGEYEQSIGYTSLTGAAWYPKAECNLRWTRHPNPENGWYYGAMILTEAVWMRDAKTRYTASIDGVDYNITYNSFMLMPSIAGIIGFRL